MSHAYANAEIRKSEARIRSIEREIQRTAAEDWGSEPDEQRLYLSDLQERINAEQRKISSYNSESYRRQLEADDDDQLNNVW